MRYGHWSYSKFSCSGRLDIVRSNFHKGLETAVKHGNIEIMGGPGVFRPLPMNQQTWRITYYEYQ